MKIGFYMRLSLADGDLGKDDKEESNSIENQRLLLQGFVESRKDITGDVTEYIDAPDIIGLKQNPTKRVSL
jgi:site-specific DNA recombinase